MLFSGVGFFFFTYGSFRRLVGLLGRGISPAPRPLSTHRTTQHRETQTHIHTPSRIRICELTVRAAEDSTCLRPLGYWDPILIPRDIITTLHTSIVISKSRRRVRWREALTNTDDVMPSVHAIITAAVTRQQRLQRSHMSGNLWLLSVYKAGQLRVLTVGCPRLVTGE
jgi:hypothetical protein